MENISSKIQKIRTLSLNNTLELLRFSNIDAAIEGLNGSYNADNEYRALREFAVLRKGLRK